MPFTSIEDARFIERAEADILRSAATAVRERRPDVVVESCEVAGGIAVFSGSGSPLNKLAGIGFAGDGTSGVPTDAEFERVEAMFASHGEPAKVDVASVADPRVIAGLQARGYRLVGFENVSGRSLDLASLPEPIAAVALEECRPEPGSVWIDTVVTGFCHPDTQGVASHEPLDPAVLEPIIADFANAGGVRCYLASVDDGGIVRVAGGGSIRCAGRLAQLCGAATLPGLRRRGVQTALLHHRLREAATAGCAFAVVTTQPGSVSQQNMHRQGFEVLYVRAVFVKGA